MTTHRTPDGIPVPHDCDGLVVRGEPGRMVAVYCTACFRTIPIDAAVRDERADWRCQDTAACGAARRQRQATTTEDAR